MNKAGRLPSARFMVALTSNGTIRPSDFHPGQRRLRCLIRHRWRSPTTGMDLQHWAVHLRIHADPATPGANECHFRSSSIHPAAFPFRPQGRRLHYSYEATHRFTCVTACTLAVGKLTTPCRHDAASSCYRGVRTTPRTGLEPARLTAVTAYGRRQLSL